MSAKQDYEIKKWQCIIKEYQESGMKLKDWCVENNIKKDKYYYWLNKVRTKYYGAAITQIQSFEEASHTTLDAQTNAFVE